MALLTVLLLVGAVANPGIKLSQDAASFSKYVQYLLQTYSQSLTFSDIVDISYKSPLGVLRTMDVNLTSIQVSNLGFSNATSTVISLAAPDSINAAIYNLTGSMKFGYSIDGKGLTLKGTGNGVIVSTALIVNATVGVIEGMPSLEISVPRMEVYNITLRLTPIPMQLYTDMQSHLSSALTSYLTANATSLYQAMCNQQLSQDTSRWIPINPFMQMDITWTQQPTIVANATSQYIVLYINGTILPTSGRSEEITIPGAISMPDRLQPAAGQGSIHYFVSQYVLESYHWAAFQYQSIELSQGQLPDNFPVELSTANGYFPEIALKYGANVPVMVNFTLVDEGRIVIDQKYGVRTNVDMEVSFTVGGQGNMVSPVTFQISMMFFSSLYISSSQFQGFPLSPILTINWVNSSIGPINSYYLSLFSHDFFAASAKSNWNAYLFPSFPIMVPKGATNARFSRMQGYIAIDLQAGS